MNSFRYNTQTACFCGPECVMNNKELFSRYGSRALIVTSQFAPGCRNYALDDVQTALSDQRISFLVQDKVRENPPVEDVVSMAAAAREFSPDFIVAIGGGSSIDSAKAISLLLGRSDCDAYEAFWGMGAPSASIRTESRIPVFAVPTTAGTGAEVSGFAVLTRADTHTKLSMYPVVFCEAAFLDAKYIREAPPAIIHTGAMDALAHGVETYLHTGSNVINRSIALMGCGMFAEYKDRLADNTLSDDDHQQLLTVAFLMGVAFMQSSTTIPHGMGYPLSHLKRVGHGLSCALFLGEYIKGFKNQETVLPVVRACGFESSNEFAEYIDRIIQKDVHIEVTEAEIEAWTDDFMKLDFRLASNPERLEREDIERLYRASLRNYLK